MKIYNSMATIIAMRLHSYMATGLMAIYMTVGLLGKRLHGKAVMLYG